MTEDMFDRMVDSHWRTINKALHKENLLLIEEYERLLSWKREATAVLDELQAQWELVGKPGVLGQSHACGMATQIEILRDESTYWQNRFHECNDAYNKLRALVAEWADASDERDAMPGVSYTDRYIKAIGALRKAVGR